MTRFSMGVATSVGRVRTNQEDSAFGTNIPAEDRDLAAIACGVFDGMGGHELGEKASGLAARFCRGYLKAPRPAGVVPLKGLLRSTHERVLHELGPGPGTTAVVATFEGGNVSFVWAGDSRLYRLRHGELRRLTKDHLTPYGTLYRYLGVDASPALRDPPVEEAYLVGDVYLLCTDGLTNEMADVELESRLSIYNRKPTDTQQIALGLVSSADAAGGRDNSTAIVVRVEA
jgi:protein phosphatase